METSKDSSSFKVWLLFGISTVGMVIFAVLYFATPKIAAVIQPLAQSVTNTVRQIVTNTVTKEVIKEVPKEVEKIVRVPAEIPEDYVAAFKLWQTMTNTTQRITPIDQVLFNIKHVSVDIDLSETLKKIVSEDALKNKFELVLRRNNVPVSSDSEQIVSFAVNGFFGQNGSITQDLLTYTVKANYYENVNILRNGESRCALVQVWSSTGRFGNCGRDKAAESILSQVEYHAEKFANDYLSANPKLK